MEVVSREVAKSLKMKRYFTGKPCKYGHLSERLVSTTRCVECIRDYKEVNAGHISEYGRTYINENKDVLAEKAKLKREQDKLTRPKRTPMNPATKKANKRAADKKYREFNKDRRKQWFKNYYASDKGKAVYRAASLRRRALVGEHGGSFSAEVLLHLEYLHNSTCPVCSADISEEYHIDHVLPVSKGGSNFVENLQLLCARCNLSKHDSLMEDWLTDTEEYWKWALRRFLFLTAIFNKSSERRRKARCSVQT